MPAPTALRKEVALPEEVPLPDADQEGELQLDFSADRVLAQDAPPEATPEAKADGVEMAIDFEGRPRFEAVKATVRSSLHEV
jgi:hypothetical protein